MRVAPLLTACCGALIALSETSAQGLRVRVIGETGDSPIPGALVSLRLAGRTTDEQLTGPAGDRFFSARPDTGYVVEVRRVGFQAYTSERFAIPKTDTQSLVLRVPAIRAVVAPPPVNARRECRPGETGRARVGELWQQVRTALLSTEIVRLEQRQPLAISRYERVLSRTGSVLSESNVGATSLGTRIFRTADGAELSRTGFVVPDTAGMQFFRAPDVAVLLSPEFAADHCYDIVAGSGATEGMIGVSFDPTPNRKLTDVRGVFWVDAETLQLKFAEFAYRFAATATDVQDVGGKILFEQLGSLNWIAREWSVRTPVRTAAGQLLGYKEEGGEAMVITPRMQAMMDSIANSRKPTGIVTGVVFDSLTNKPFAGARVWVDSAGAQTRTDSKGLYFLRGVTAGPHFIQFAHPMLDSIGVRPTGAVVSVVPEQMVDRNLAGPSLSTLVGKSCGENFAVVTGTVTDVAAGTPVDSVEVQLSWIDMKLGPDRKPVLIVQRETMATTDASGRYGACVDANAEITGFAKRGIARTARVDVLPEARRIGIMDFRVDLSATDTATGAAELRGVVKYQDGTPLRSAIVTLSDPELTTSTDTAGNFRIRGIPGGTRALDARALGHAPQRVMVDAVPGKVTDVSIYMRKVTTLDPIIVRAAADDRTAETLAGLAERQRRHQGYRLQGAQLRPFRGARLDAVFRTMQYAKYRSTPSISITLQDRNGKDCKPTVWLDGRRSDIYIASNILASDVMSVEVLRLRSETPVEYQDMADCGAILIWLNPIR